MNALQAKGVEIRAPDPQIPLLLYPTQDMMNLTHVRVQEHYENPELKGKIFTLEQFVPVYMRQKNRDTFTYFQDWNGCNTPSRAMTAFFEGRFDPLSQEEHDLFTYLRTIKQPFYLIATHRSPFSIPGMSQIGIVRHELAHGLFEIGESYRKEARAILSRFDTRGLAEHLKDEVYDESVLEDEMHAQAVYSRPSAREFIPDQLSEQMNALFIQTIQPSLLSRYVEGLSRAA